MGLLKYLLSQLNQLKCNKYLHVISKIHIKSHNETLKQEIYRPIVCIKMLHSNKLLKILDHKFTIDSYTGRAQKKMPHEKIKSLKIFPTIFFQNIAYVVPIRPLFSWVWD